MAKVTKLKIKEVERVQNLIWGVKDIIDLVKTDYNKSLSPEEQLISKEVISHLTEAMTELSKIELFKRYVLQSFFNTVAPISHQWSNYLQTTTFADGEDLKYISNDVDAYSAYENKQPGWAYIDYDIENAHLGKLYNWHAIRSPKGLAPMGYRIPTEEDFEDLIALVEGHGNLIKATGYGKDAGVGTGQYPPYLSILAKDKYYHYGTDFIIWSCSNYDRYKGYALIARESTDDLRLGSVEKDSLLPVICVKEN